MIVMWQPRWCIITKEANEKPLLIVQVDQYAGNGLIHVHTFCRLVVLTACVGCL